MRIVVLKYHRLVGAALPHAERGQDLYSLTRGRFRRHLAILSGSGLPVVPFAALAAPEASASPARGVAITFDDGHASDFSEALPALLEYGFPAAFFVTAAWVGRRGHLDWPQVRELRACGMAIGAHGWDHRPLSALSPRELARQLRDARLLIEEHVGAPPDFLALPRGAGSAGVVAAAFQAGYRAIAGSLPRRWTRWSAEEVIPRYAMRRTDSLASFRALVHQEPAALRRAWTRYRYTDVMRGAVAEDLDPRFRRAAPRMVLA